MAAGDLLIHLRAAAAGAAAYPVEAELADGSRFDGGSLVVDQAAFLASEHDADPATYGRTLFAALFAGSIGTAYARAVPASDDAVLRIRLLLDPDVTGLEFVRWERLYRQRRDAWIPLATAGDTPFSRYRALPSAEPRPVATLPIRILLAVANPTGLPAGLQPVDVEGEIDNFRQALREAAASDDVEVTVLPGRTGISAALRAALVDDGFVVVDGPTTLPQLARRLGNAHLLHIVGHGGFRRGDGVAPPMSSLFLESDAGAWAPATADQLVATFAALEATPALVYLSACESGITGTEAAHPFVGLAPRLIDAGVAAVVAMQDVVAVGSARVLAQTFYASLLEHGVVDLALNQARSVVAAAGGLEWTIPILLTRLRGGRLLVERSLAGRVISDDIAITPGAAHGAIADRIGSAPEPRPRPAPVLLLPRDFPDLLGREAEVGQALDDLRSGSFLEFHAAAGEGKSVLLRHIANRAPGLVPDGIVHVGQATEPVHDTLQFLFDALYEADASLRPTDADLQKLLAIRGPGIVLDDADVPRDDLGRLIALVPKGRFLIAASTRTLWGEGSAVALGGLAPEPSLALFERGLGRALTAEERPTAAALCASLAGHPLHILQAADLVAEHGWPAPAAAGVPPSTRPAVAALTADERSVLALLAAAGAPVRLDRLESIVGSAVGDACASLERAGLIRAGSPRYVLTEPLSEAELGALDVRGARDRLLAELIAWVEQNRNSPAVLIRELDTILALVDGPAATEQPAQVARLARGAEGALILAKRWTRWGQLLGLEESSARAAGDQAALGWARHQQGTRALALQDQSTARTALGEALRIRETIGDVKGAAVTRHNLEVLGVVGPPGGGQGGARGGWLRRLPRPFGALLAVAVVAIVVVGAAALGATLLRPAPTGRFLPSVSLDQATIDFGSVQVGSSAERTLTVTNGGAVALEISAVAIDPPVADLQLNDGCTGTVAPAASCQIIVDFSPTADGDRGSSLSIDDNTLEAHHSVPILAAGAQPPGQPGITIDPSALDFGSIDPQANGVGSITVTSTGAGDLQIGKIQAPTDPRFGMTGDGCSGATLAPGKACEIEVTFTPHGDVGDFKDVLVVFDNTAEASHSVTLFGSGLVRLPDLTIALDTRGDVTFRDGSMVLPVTVIVRNSGDAAAGPFRITGQAIVPRQSAQPSVIGLEADPSDGVAPSDIGGVSITAGLPPGGELRFTGRLVFGPSYQAEQVSAAVLADSCAGQEIFDPFVTAHCSVPETDETNNLSNQLQLTMPVLVTLGLWESRA